MGNVLPTHRDTPICAVYLCISLTSHHPGYIETYGVGPQNIENEKTWRTANAISVSPSTTLSSVEKKRSHENTYHPVYSAW